MAQRCPYCAGKYSYIVYAQDIQMLRERIEDNPRSKLANGPYICDLCAATEQIADLIGLKEGTVRRMIEETRLERKGDAPNSFDEIRPERVLKPESYFAVESSSTLEAVEYPEGIVLADGSVVYRAYRAKKLPTLTTTVTVDNSELRARMDEAVAKMQKATWALTNEGDTPVEPESPAEPTPPTDPQSYIIELRKKRRKLE